jgi:hypothetical protein
LEVVERIDSLPSFGPKGWEAVTNHTVKETTPAVFILESLLHYHVALTLILLKGRHHHDPLLRSAGIAALGIL